MVGNSFTGTLPTELGNLIQLRELHLVRLDDITGTIPSHLVALTGLEILWLADLPGINPTPFPEVFKVASNLTSVIMYRVDMTGSLPTIGHLSDLQTLDLGNIEVTGTIPIEIGLLSDLVKVSLVDLNLQGTIPSEVGLLTKLTTLDLSDNPQIGGTFPSEIGSLTALKSLDLRMAELVGTIPREVCALNLQPTITFKFSPCKENNGFVDEKEWCLSDTCNI